MAYTLTQTINWALTYGQYSPLTAGLGQEPATTIASMIRNTLLNAPLTWAWNRAETTFDLAQGTQDYTVTLADFGFMETLSIADDAGSVYELKTKLNNDALAVSAVQQRPNSVSVQRFTSGNPVFRFIGVPDKVYHAKLVYQKKAPIFGPFFIASVNGAGVYTGVFDPLSFPVGSKANITGFTNAGNNGSFVVTACTSTLLTVTATTTIETASAYATQFDWSPIPDQYSDIYNNLFLGEMFAMVDDSRSEVYRRRGVAAFLAKSEGLSEMQQNVFMQQWLAMGAQSMAHSLRVQQASQARAV
jgi:hypothetical protein